MTDQQNAQPKKFRYFMVHTRPVKLTLDEKRRYKDAHIPDRETGGLKRDLNFLDIIMDRDCVTEIDEARYNIEFEKYINSEPKTF